MNLIVKDNIIIDNIVQDNNFEKLKSELYSEALNGMDDSSLTSSFGKNFSKLIELCIFSLMKGEDNFFAFFIISMKKHISFELKEAVTTVPNLSYFDIYFNPTIFLDTTLKEMQALLKHEIYHIINRHYERRNSLKSLYSLTAINLAMDISINQYISNLPIWCEKLENVSRAYNCKFKEDGTFEEYTRILQDSINKLNKNNTKIENATFENHENDFISNTLNHQIKNAHNFWDNSNNILSSKDISDLTRNATENAILKIHDKSKIPMFVEKYVKDLNKQSQLTWTHYLKSMIGSLPCGYKKVSTRKNRRQPERLDLRGTISKYTAKIVIALDISGSMHDNDISNMMVEIFEIIKNYNHEVTLIECDSEIRRVSKITTVRDLKKKINTRGSTSFSPVFEYIKKQRLNDSILIYFTDGKGESHLKTIPSNLNVLWVLTGQNDKLSLISPIGLVKKLSIESYEKPDYTYMKTELKELLEETVLKFF